MLHYTYTIVYTHTSYHNPLPFDTLPQQSLLLNNKAGTNEGTGADGQYNSNEEFLAVCNVSMIGGIRDL